MPRTLTDAPPYIMVMLAHLARLCHYPSLQAPRTDPKPAIAEGHGDTALVLLKAGAETDKKDTSGSLAIDLAPDAKVHSL